MEQLRDGIFVETAYNGVNVAAVSTTYGMIALDAPSLPRHARDWATRLHRMNHHAIRFTVLTDCHGDRIMNTRWFNAPIITHQATAEKLVGYDKRFPQPLLDSLIARYPDASRDLSSSSVERPSVTFDQKLSLVENGRMVQLLFAPGPTPGNILVYLPEDKILFTGDVVCTQAPLPCPEGGYQQWLQTLYWLRGWAPEITCLIPGRGTVGDLGSIELLIAFLQTMWQCLQTHITEGRPREETAVYIPSLLSSFPLADVPTDWAQKQLKHSLDRLYDEVQLAHQDNKVLL